MKTLPIHAAFLFLLCLVSLPADAKTPRDAQYYLTQAVRQCDQALAAGQADNPLGNQALHRNALKYQQHRARAQALNANALTDTAKTYKSTAFGEQPFAALDTQCMAELTAKQAQSAGAPTKPMPQLTAPAQARAQAAQAVRRFCMAYTKPPYSAGPVNKARLAQDETAYRQAKDAALAAEPKVAQTKLKALIPNPKTRLGKETEKTVAQWFTYCDQAFAAYAKAIADLPDAPTSAAVTPTETVAPVATTAAPPAPVAEVQPAATESAPPADEPPADAPPADEPPPASDGGEESDPELAQLKGKVKGDRLKTLEQEGRVPDFTDNDDHMEKATIWQYEYEDDSGKPFCVQFQFKGDKLDNEEELDGECPAP